MAGCYTPVVQEPLQQGAPDSAGQSEYFLLPDLMPAAPRQLLIERQDDSGRRELRFDSRIINAGQGPLEMVGSYDAETNLVRAVQRILNTQGEFEERLAGYFVYHESHNHWHFEKFIVLELFSIDEEGLPGELVAATDKMSFCIMDRTRVYTLPGAPATPIYARCDPVIQGLSVGRMDVYEPALPGQELDIEGLPDGSYFLRVTIDPEDRLRETAEDNNSLTVRITINGMSVSVPSPS